jgi:hypothetical protein
LDHCIDPLLFLVLVLDLWIFFHSCPKLYCFLEQFSCHANMFLYIMQLCCSFLLPFLLHCWWSCWYNLLQEILDLLMISINFLRNLVDLFCGWGSSFPWEVLGSFPKMNSTMRSSSFLHSFSSQVSYLSCAQTVSSASRFFVSCCRLTKFLCARDCISWSTLTYNLYSSLNGILVKTNWMWSKSFRGVFPTISSICNMLGFM